MLRNTRNLVLLTVGQVDVRGAGLTGVVKAVKEQTERPLEVRFIALERLRERCDPRMLVKLFVLPDDNVWALAESSITRRV